jgi:glycosyltransferase involved in cell wall biosynthesis
MITFSIITATLNTGNALRKTLDSVLAQTYDASLIEMVIVDGASTDNTVAIIKEYESRFSGRLKWISESDNVIYSALNKGIMIATGEVLNVKGAGDWLEEDALKKVAQVFNNEPETDLVCSLLNEWDPPQPLHYRQTIFKAPQQLLEHYWCMHQAYFYRSQLHTKYGLYPTEYRIVGDLAFFAALINKNSLQINIIYQPLANFVLDGISAKEDILSTEMHVLRSIYEPVIAPTTFFPMLKKIPRLLKKTVKFACPYAVLWLFEKLKTRKSL